MKYTTKEKKNAFDFMGGAMACMSSSQQAHQMRLWDLGKLIFGNPPNGSLFKCLRSPQKAQIPLRSS